MLNDSGEADYRVAHAVMAGLGLLVIVLSFILKCTTEAGAASETTAGDRRLIGDSILISCGKTSPVDPLCRK